ncbi:MAG: methylenetetrahydrofolate--tRNA-(uracil(54)-C(5))-methyltransferase (FADH(2)-oxidizing) TrmFO [Bdellovibrionales bacterium RIFOXYD1_FULL_53_11]|nr:MAG: methylenetetrahydrofolate--tRNA-(uracil(54)-C(5))-methyltransferase (FADH(2)-oxidizing) TrmFO [Bdellovibrionales bacterium RIFOXYD1_FULL_53_11]
MRSVVNVIGAGLAGSEAAYFLAERGIRVVLYEMRPAVSTPAHKTALFAELVCSNSFKSLAAASAPGILKNELLRAGSLVLRAAGGASVPAGEALAVDREIFAATVTRAIKSHPGITVINEESHEPPAGAPSIIATGPLTSPAMAAWLAKTAGSEQLYFYDAIAPVVEASSIDMTKIFEANRYNKGGEEAYVNCPLDDVCYHNFVGALHEAEKVEPRPFEKAKYFQGCQPIETIAASGHDALRYGPMKPVGLTDPATGKEPHAVVQLRAENKSKTAYNLVGFQTRMKHGAQERVFRMIPALAGAKFLRLGSIHRNTYVCGPSALWPDLSLRGRPLVYLAGQIAGVEGYLESTACGMLSAVFALQRLQGRPHSAPPADTATGALLRHVTGGNPDNFQPSNIHFGLFDMMLFPGATGGRKEDSRKLLAAQASGSFEAWWKEQSL